MFKSLMGFFMVLMISFCLSSRAYASTITLLSGQKIEGQLVEQTELRILFEVDGVLKTFFLGELASIDGKPVEMPQAKAAEAALTEVKRTVPVKNYHDEQTSLERFMLLQKAPPVQPASSVPSASSPQAPSAMVPVSAATNKAVVSTPDGGLIVVDNNKIIKFDKDFKIIKQVNLNS